MASRIVWRGAELQIHIRAAQRRALNETTAACVVMAKSLVRTDTTALQGSIQMRPAVASGPLIVGRWGSFDINYAFWQEVLPEPRGRAYLRPSADTWYPTLALRIKAYVL